MPTTLTSLAERVSAKVGDTRGLNPRDYILPAVRRYEKVRPRKVVVDKAGTGSADRFNLTTAGGFPDWATEWSRILFIEYPVDDTEASPSYLSEAEDWKVVRKADLAGAAVEDLLLAVTPAATETFRVGHTARHAVADTGTPTSSIPSEDEEAIAYLASALLLYDVAAAFVGTSVAPNIVADLSEGPETKSRDAREQGRVFESLYRAHLGIDAKAENGGPGGVEAKPRVRVRDHDFRFSRGRAPLTRERRSY